VGEEVCRKYAAALRVVSVCRHHPRTVAIAARSEVARRLSEQTRLLPMRHGGGRFDASL